ncbi:MAG: ribonuclease Y [Elusimicrobiota bacterium]
MSSLILYILVSLIFGLIAGVVGRGIYDRSRENKNSREFNKRIEKIQHNKEKQLKQKEKELEKEKEKFKNDFKAANKDARQEIKEKEKNINQRLRKLEQKADVLQSKEKEISEREKDMEDLERKYHEKEREIQKIKKREKIELQKISKLSPKQAREELMRRVEEKAKDEAQRVYNKIVDSAKRDAQRESIEIITRAIQRNASDVTQEITVTTVDLPNDDMKGRIIGREGRNIRALESATGVNIIIDDTPGIITVSSFDGIRRQIAKKSLELLIKDGRIQPVRIEEVVNKVKKEVDDTIIKAGEEAAMEAGVVGLHDEEVKLLGKLKYRTSYGQNVLKHSIEVANLAGVMADELNIDGEFARRAGFLHDIGKAVDREVEGKHAQIGADLVKKFGESRRLQNAVEAHHEDVDPETSEAVLIEAADAISASRPGARKENVEFYVKRMNKIEEIASEFEGVRESYCVSAGREIRIIVEPGRVDDLKAANIAKECAEKIENKVEYPGEIKVTVIRSLKSSEVAK